MCPQLNQNDTFKNSWTVGVLRNANLIGLWMFSELCQKSTAPNSNY